MSELNLSPTEIQLAADLICCPASTVRAALTEEDHSAQLREKIARASTFNDALRVILETKPGTYERIDAVNKALELASTKSDCADYKLLFVTIGRDSVQRNAVIRRVAERIRTGEARKRSEE